jgi:beta-phosphoglucomutase-like phosphatase (HAD superfamily)
MAVVSASNNAHQVLESAGLVEFFPVIVDGHQAQAEGLAGKPAPDTYLAAARQLGADPARTAVVEDALGGVSAGRAGGFSPVIGVDRGAGGPALIAHGATLVVDDLDQLLLDPPRTELPAEGPGPIVGRENPPLSDQLPAGWPTPTVGAEDGQSSDEED